MCNYIIDEYVKSVCCNIKSKRLSRKTALSLKNDIKILSDKYLPYLDDRYIATLKAIHHFGDPISYANNINNRSFNLSNILCCFL
ncbi:MAG: hypothetical protein IAC55_01670 [Tyzzerella sp.]|uniref:Uncharacterized protein n=1 Tax=Candidatus Fimicola merdigallinarum TaxID=2840819 RepID=A0A9D9H0J1_9FIRM|nr:hypothetical protein [Candidatus Fimicola merdigallinarum]